MKLRSGRKEVDENSADELLKRALIEPESSVSVALRVGGLSLSEGLTIVFHGRPDLGTVQTYVANGGRKAGMAVAAGELLRVPCDLDLAAAEDMHEAEEQYLRQARIMRDILVSADVVLSVWREPLEETAQAFVQVDSSVDLDVKLPAHRLMPCALAVPERGIVITPVCGARALAEGKPPLGIACAQRDFVRVYPFPDDPEEALDDFFDAAAEHARNFAERLRQQEVSVQRFLKLSGEDCHQTG
jgi:hypothetical protein